MAFVTNKLKSWIFLSLNQLPSIIIFFTQFRVVTFI